jgi:hypothetical protein
VDLLRNAQQPLLALCLGPVLAPVAVPAPAAGAASVVAYPPAPAYPAPSAKLAVQAPKKNSQPVCAARAVRATARP